jgi:mTERF domain-containing protein
MFTHSLSQRIIPRAFVLQYLLNKGLWKTSLVNPFNYTEKVFLEKCVFKFKEESDYLLKLYEDKMNLAYTKKKTKASN